MTVQVLTGVLLVLATWTVAAAAIVGTGLLPALASDRKAGIDAVLRASLWWGTGILALAILAASLVTPMRSVGAAVTVAVVVVLLAAGGVPLAVRRARRVPSRWRRPTRSITAVLAVLAFASAYLAVKALGPVTNYDSGLYHLGAVAYAGDYSAVPGLANLYFPLGYNNSLFPAAAFLGNGPWDGAGFRLLNGLLVLLVSLDLALRLLARRWTWGTFVLLVGIGTVYVPLVAIADFWVTSPTSDSAVLLLTLVATAYLADVLGARRGHSLNAAVTGVAVLLAVSMRPTMAAFAATALVVVIGASIVRRRTERGVSGLAWLLLGAFAVVVAALQTARDYVLSGWLLYPVSLHAFDVPWRAVDPIVVREATLSAARDPSRPDHGIVAHSWAWIPSWVHRSLTQWETYFLALGLLAAVVALLLAHRSGARLHVRRILACVAPSAVASVAWFTLSPPSYRFGWGPLFTLFIVPLAAALLALTEHSRQGAAGWPARVDRRAVLAIGAGVLLLVTGYSAALRSQAGQISETRSFALGPVSVAYAVAPIPTPPTEEVVSSRGFTTLRSSEGDQCWDVFPLCTPMPDPDLGPRGETLQDGFIH
jgi:hypothetical protein